MLSAGDPVNLGERRHLIVELADIAAHDVEIGAWFHHRVMDVVVLLEEPCPETLKLAWAILLISRRAVVLKRTQRT